MSQTRQLIQALPERNDRDERAGSWMRNSKLAIACAVLFLTFWCAQSVAGWHVYNSDQLSHGGATVGYASYLAKGHFIEATFENWESEFLQMGAFILLTIFLLQKGSGESKKEHDDPHDDDPRAHRHDPDSPWPVRRGGVWLLVYENSLLLAFATMFLASVAGHVAGGVREYNEELVAHGQQVVGSWGYFTSSQFWFESFQNWQSEFLAVASIVVLTIMLRQKGSPESKPVHAPTGETGE